MKIILTEIQYKKLQSNKPPINLLRRFDLIKSTIPKVIKYYDVDEYAMMVVLYVVDANDGYASSC
jgi:hypothetical protein